MVMPAETVEYRHGRREGKLGDCRSIEVRDDDRLRGRGVYSSL